MSDKWDVKLAMEGKKFGKWEVLKLIDIGKPGKHYECMCECGNTKIIPGTTLRAGRSKQCPSCQYLMLYDPQKMIGQKFGKWTVINYIGVHRELLYFTIQCECGNLSKAAGADLRAGKTKQCATCHNKENAINNIKHGMHNTLIYKVWCSMIHRCENPKAQFYNRYGGRGIKVCKRWHKFENFYADMGERPDGMTIDRIDNNGNYEPTNCRWVTHQENCNNRGY